MCALGRGKEVMAVNEILADVAKRGDEAIVDSSRKFDDPAFTVDQIRVTLQELADAAKRVAPPQLAAIRHAIGQVREYQQAMMPPEPRRLDRPGVSLTMRFTPVDSAGLYFPGGKASYPSSLIHLAVPAQVAGVNHLAVVTPPSKYGRSDLVLAAAHELGLTHVYRAGGGAAAIGALAFGTKTIPPSTRSSVPAIPTCNSPSAPWPDASGLTASLGPAKFSSWLMTRETPPSSPPT